MMINRFILTILAVCFSFGVTAGTFPERNIENIFPWGPGTSYAVTQLISDSMAEELGVNINVISTPGGAGVKAIETALKKPADGYTIIDAWVANLVLQPNLGNGDYTYKDFKPLWSATQVPFSISVRRNETRWHDLPSFVEYAQKHPGEIRYSSGSYNNLPHMIMAQLLRSQGIYARNIPYSQDGDAHKDVRSGLLDFTFTDPTTYRSNADAFKPLVVLHNDKKLLPCFDNGPTLDDYGIDLGLSGLSAVGWNWFVVHKDTPDEVVEILRAAMKKAIEKPELQQQLAKLGFLPLMLPPDKYEESVLMVSEQLKNAQTAIIWEQEQLEKAGE
ncbi:tripartite tricarboxylate transporter substrate binding protein [Vibrio mimicus]|uniref:tripartite tricarboxylate transporter substrate binding protein n=1 Tax=Vibrio mimicus TaxID=674 RepID=UPI00076B2B85|nr:tripartite tricarboxylate transporter substrate binding protein [Vibrio mimicus]AMG04782.1 tripartite tricarboxylate transporter substrate binding protein [Vibrio mimicus]KAA3493476.1 tripartite tricarboxylate transporter substrate binding protein [Vibrio mimicus]